MTASKNTSLIRPSFLNTFTSYTSKAKPRNFAVWDIETADGTLLGPTGGIAATTSHDYPAVMIFRKYKNRSPSIAFLSWALRKRYRSFVFMAHKALSFDLTHLLADKRVHRWLARKKVTATITQSFVTFRINKHVWIFADSIRLFHEKLEFVLKAFAPEHTKAKLPEGGFSWENQAWRLRVLGDVRGLFVALLVLDKTIRRAFDVTMNLTMPSTALRAARHCMTETNIPRPSRLVLDWLRTSAYTGGRIEVFWQGEYNSPVAVLDINSAYAWAMKYEFPIGDGSYIHKEPASGYYIALCRVQVPDMFIPPINDKLSSHAFAIGTYVTMLTKEEIEFARKCHVIVDILEGWKWNHAAPIFKPFIEKCRKLRSQDYDGPLGKAVKLAQNGLYGILGMNPFRHDYLLSVDDPLPPWIPTMNQETGEESHLIYERLMYKESIAQMPHWAAIITARVRVRLTELLLKIQALGMVPLYSHTDSIWVPSITLPLIQSEITSQYGGLKHEAQGTRAIIVAPGEAALEKDLCWKPLKVEEQLWRIASKGFRAKAEDFLRAEPHKIEQVQVFRVTTAIKRFSPGRNITKAIGDYSAIRNRRPAQERPGLTHALVIQQDCDAMRRDWSLPSWHIGKHQKLPGLSTILQMKTESNT